MDALPPLLLFAIFFAASLYTCVGHGGASAYLALMSLLSISPEIMRPLALCLNLLAAGIAAVRFCQAGRIQWRLLILLTISSIPFSFGAAHFSHAWILDKHLINLILGFTLLSSAVAMSVFFIMHENARQLPNLPDTNTTIISGIILGTMAGVTGTGGGIYLSPLMVLRNWVSVEATTGTVALFIWFNSMAALLGQANSIALIAPILPQALVTVGLGALVGTQLSLDKMTSIIIRVIMIIVIAIAGIKLLWLS